MPGLPRPPGGLKPHIRHLVPAGPESSLRPLGFIDDTHVRIGRSVRLYFGGCNYLGLAWNPVLRRALVSAARSGPFQTGASRRTTGEHPAFNTLESAAARFFRTEAAAYFGSGYLASVGALDGLRHHASHVLLDDGAHRCLQDGARVCGLPVIRFASWNADALADALRSLPRGSRAIVAVDGTGAIRPGLAPLREYLARLPRNGWLVVDDAHGAGTVEPQGRGACASMGLSDPRLVQCVTLAKAFAAAGGLVLGSAETVEILRANAGAYTGSTAQPIALLAAATASVRWVERHPGRVRRLHSNLVRFAKFTASLTRFSFDPRTPVGTWVPKDADEAARLAKALEREGIHPPWIRYPGGPEAGFFRFAISAAHTTEDLASLARVLRFVDSGTPGKTG